MKNIFKLTIKCITVMLPAVGLSIILRAGYMYYIIPEEACLFWNKKMTSSTNDEYIESIVIGDSSGNAAFMPEATSGSMVNLSILGTSPVEGYYTLKEYLENNKAPKNCFVCYNDVHFHMMGVYWDEIVANHRFNIKDNLEIIKNAQSEITSDNCYSAISDYVAYELYFPSKYMSSINAAINDYRNGINRYENNGLALERIALHSGRFAYIGNQVFETVQTREYTDMGGTEVYVEYMNKIVELCAENDIYVYLVKPPMPDNSVMTDQYIKDVESFYGRFANNFDNVSFVWDEKIYEARYFADETHLNNDGAYRFSSYIGEKYSDILGNSRNESEQMLAMDDTIQMENMPIDLFAFIKGRDYSVFVYNPNDEMEQLLNQYTDGYLSCERLDAEFPIYLCYEGKKNNLQYDIKADSNGLLINLGTEEGSSRWVLPDGQSVSLLVIDNINRKIVAIKNIEYYGIDGYSKWFN